MKVADLRSLFVFAMVLWAPCAGAIDLRVYNTNNAGAGSLRQAVQDNNALGGNNTITFASNVTATINITSELVVTTNVTIVGPGSELLRVNANGFSHIFNVSGGTVVISGLTLVRGQTFSDGGAIYNAGTLHVSNCLFNANYGPLGGGVYNLGTAHLANCQFTTNSSGLGGAIHNLGTLTLTNCLFWGNGSYEAGAVFNSGTMAASRCSFVYNGVTQSGGALQNTNGTADLYMSTLTGNKAGTGGAIYTQGALTLSACTITTNDATFAGGVYGPATVRSTIIAGNGIGNGIDAFDDVYGTCISQGYNLIGITNASSGWGAFDLGGETASPLFPKLYPIGMYGGLTPTMPPLFDSPTKDGSKAFGDLSDQRDRLRPYDHPNNPNAPGGDGTDIGAAEIGWPIKLLVTNNKDSGAGSLRQAIVDASPWEGDVIEFAPTVTNTITLTSGEIVLSKSVGILGPTNRTLTISGNNSNRVFHITGGQIGIFRLTIAHGLAANDFGGGILMDDGGLSLFYSQVVSNAATGFSLGGGILIRSNASLDIEYSTIAHNQAGLVGGGIAQSGTAALLIFNSTIAHNQTINPYDGLFTPHGGGIALDAGQFLMVNSTVASNVSSYVGGGISKLGGGTAADIRNCIIARNRAVNSRPDVVGPFFSNGYNLIGNPSDSTGWGATGDQFNVDPLLGPLANYGGPTPTMALRAGSPAIDKGKSFGSPIDQRGRTRVLDDPNISDAVNGDGADIGAFEVDPNFRIVDLRRTGNDVGLSLMTVLGRNYRVEHTNALASTGAWTIFTNNVPGNGHLLWVTDYGGANQARRFYRGAIVP